jgi:crotonobetainyl-CoA:carnitine CoA-transferase CaiB-like acyl-CoA transferase
MTHPFAGIRVLDLSTRLSGAFAARVFGDFGAEVILAEPPEGHPLRHEPPFLNNTPDADSGILHAYVNWNKKSIVVDDRDQLARLIASAEIVITTTARSDDASLEGVIKHAASDTIHISITPHGLDGPLTATNGNNLTACARTGWSYINVYKDEPPVQLPNQTSGYVAGITGFITGAAALYQRNQTGHGEQIDISELEPLALTCHPWGIQAILSNAGRSRGVLGGKARGLPGPLWQAKDGLINFGFGDWHNWTDSMNLIGLPEYAEVDELIPDIGRHSRDLRGVVAGADKSVRSLNCWDLFHGLSKLRSISGVVQNMDDLLRCEQLAAREYLVDSQVKGRSIKFPGPPAKLSPAKWRLQTPAPEIDQDADEIEAHPRVLTAKPKPSRTPSPEGPLHGIRVLTFTHAWSGTFATELLSLLGADVIQIEAPHRVDVWRRTFGRIPKGVVDAEIPQHAVNTQGLYNSVNLNKRAITLDMSRQEGRNIFWELVPKFDVLVENFTPQIMSRWGITLETLAAKRPGIIFASISAYGLTGPYSQYPGNGATTEPMSGLSSIHGYAGDSGMNTGGMIPDPVSGYFMAASIMSALHARERTGEAQRIDESMLESLSIMVGDALGTFQATGEMPGPAGNKHPRIAPHSVYPTMDGDWVAIACETDDAWIRFSERLGLKDDPRFSSMANRKANEQELDGIVSAWSETLNAKDAEDIVNGLGGCAARVAPLYEIYTKPDADLLAREFIAEVEHPESGINILPARPWKFASVKSSPVRASPCVGQHSEEVLREELNVTAAEFQELVDQGITGTIYHFDDR